MRGVALFPRRDSALLAVEKREFAKLLMLLPSRYISFDAQEIENTILFDQGISVLFIFFSERKDFIYIYIGKPVEMQRFKIHKNGI